MAKNISTTSQLFHYIGMLAEKLNTEVYVVGGYVRDKYLGLEVKDIDFTVINNGIRFARALADALGVNNIVCYEKFGTCMIPYKDYRLEFVQARSEKYEPNSRKPIVSVGDLRADLERRDFTINTLARKLTREGLGELVDLFNGREDLRNKIIRTPLNPVLTFDDDPLRMIRAIRFVVRLG